MHVRRCCRGLLPMHSLDRVDDGAMIKTEAEHGARRYQERGMPMNHPEDDDRQRRPAQRLEELGPLARDLAALTRLQIVVVLGGITVAGLLVLLVALIAAVLRWLF